MPVLYGKIAAALLSNGQPEAAQQAWNAFLAYAEVHASIPPHQLLRGYRYWMLALLKTGRADEARELARWARDYAARHDVPQIHRTVFSPDFLERYLAEIKTESPPPQLEETTAAFLHPSSLTTVGVPSYTSRTAVFLINPSSRTNHGILEVTGAPVVTDSAPAAHLLVLRRSSTRRSAPLRIPLAVEPGQFLKIYRNYSGVVSASSWNPGVIVNY